MNEQTKRYAIETDLGFWTGRDFTAPWEGMCGAKRYVASSIDEAVFEADRCRKTQGIPARVVEVTR